MTTDGRTIRLSGGEKPAVNDRRDVVVAVLLQPPGSAIVDGNEVVLESRVELVDHAVPTSRFLPVAISNQGMVAAHANLEQQGRAASGIVTQTGVVVASGDLMPDGRVIDDIQIPALTGEGEVAFVAEVGGKQTVLIGNATRACRNRLDSDAPVPTDYGAAYDVDDPSVEKELAVQVRCGFGRTVLQVGTGKSEQLINPDAFLWEDGAWQRVELKGEDETDDGWLVGAAGADLELDGAQLRDERLVVAQICSTAGGVLRCGCRDAACAEAFWQLQAFRRPASDEPGSDPPLAELPAPPPAAEPPAFEPPPSEPPPDDAEDLPGAQVFRKCRACHVADEPTNKVGPHLVGIFGRGAGTVEGFQYSDALAESGIVWNDDTLAAFLADPRGFILGNRMVFVGLQEEQDILDLLAYLRVVAGSS